MYEGLSKIFVKQYFFYDLFCKKSNCKNILNRKLQLRQAFNKLFQNYCNFFYLDNIKGDSYIKTSHCIVMTKMTIITYKAVIINTFTMTDY